MMANTVPAATPSVHPQNRRGQRSGLAPVGDLVTVVAMRSSAPTGSRIWLGLILACAAATWVQAAPSSSDAPAPAAESNPLPYPSAILATVRNQAKAVTSVDGMTPCVVLDGKAVPLGKNPRAMPVRGPGYVPGRVDLSVVASKGIALTIKLPDGSTAPGNVWEMTSNVTVRLMPAISYDDCYLVLMGFNGTFLKGAVPSPDWRLIFKDVGALKAGEAKTVDFNMGPMRPDDIGMDFVPILYCGGAEVRSNLSRFTAALFRSAELAEHALVVRSWLQNHLTSDQPLKRYVLPQPVFPPDVDVAKLPKTIEATFVVTPQGTVEHPELKDNLPPAAARAIRRALSEWLFFPRLKSGHAVSTKVSVPIAIAASK